MIPVVLIIERELWLAEQVRFWRGKCQIALSPMAYRSFRDMASGMVSVPFLSSDGDRYHGHRVVMREQQSRHVEVIIE
jgi:hypothetical protein